MQNRREFMKGSSVFAAMMAAAPSIVVGQGAARVFKVGMIGAGSRCTGATANLIEAAKSVGHEIKVVAVCDFFEDKAKAAAKKFGCDEKMAFSTAAGYKKVVESDCEIIVTATPPAFRKRLGLLEIRGLMTALSACHQRKVLSFGLCRRRQETAHTRTVHSHRLFGEHMLARLDRRLHMHRAESRGGRGDNNLAV